ncbi:rho GTPase-activating protein 26-like isoform X3 [Clytia hemisphaerica]|uniref:Rho GTPase-activating protein 26 n=1 Tax=Clytia hemisphaerica TaxID=252671 RepID=A0A7M5VFC8_9CNID
MKRKSLIGRQIDRVCALVESHLKYSPKKKDTMLSEADTQVELELHKFRELSLEYVTKLQEVNEKKKFELVEIILAYMYGQSTFYHNGHEVFQDHKNYLTDLQFKLQTTRERFDVTKIEAQDLKEKTKKRFAVGDLHKGAGYSRQGYLLVHDKRKSVLGPQWVKHYCSYTKENKILTMVPYTQTNTKLNANTDTIIVTSCTRRPTESSERRFLFDITGQDRSQPLTMQCLSEDDRKLWLEVMEGKEPIYMESNELKQNDGVTNLDQTGLQFILKCMEGIERRGLTDQGIYRIAGVSSKFNKLLNTGIDPKQIDRLDLTTDESPWEVKTITSAMKQYFRNLSEPVFTFKLHDDFLSTLKLETAEKKVAKLKELVNQLPNDRGNVLNRLMYHLKLVAGQSKQNLMQESNLGVVLGPTLMRSREETMAAIMSIKFQSIVIETMIKEYDQIFTDGPPQSLLSSISSNNNNNTAAPLNVPANPIAPRSPGRNSKKRAPEPPTAATKPVVKSRSEGEPVGGKPPPPERPQPYAAGRPGKISSDDQKEILKKQHSTPANNPIKPKYPPPGRPPNLGGSLKRWPHLAARPSPNGKPLIPLNGDDKIRLAETVTPFTSPPEDDSEAKSRRNSYAKAMDKIVKSVDVAESGGAPPLKSPPPISQKPKLQSIQQSSAPFANNQIPPKPGVPPPQVPKRKEWKVRALYDCIAENTSELSFNKGAIITNVKSSTEEGWLIGTLNGRSGFVPENYCEKFED